VASGAEQMLLGGAGLLAGLTGSAGGITSLITYPVLLGVGIAPLPANVTQAVAFAACLPGSAAGSRPELRGQGGRIGRWGCVAVVAGLGGVALLLDTPQHLFGLVVPYLLALAAAALLLQPRITWWQDQHPGRNSARLFPLGLVAVSVYSGYFGAGSGVMILALLLLTVERSLPRANALKNVVLGLADAVAAVAFALFGPVRWWAAWPLALGLLAGSTLGPSITRRVPQGPLRVGVALVGLGLAVRLWIAPV